MGGALGTLVGVGAAIATGGLSMAALPGIAAAGQVGGMIGGALQGASGGAGSPGAVGQAAQQQVDPWAAYRPQYAQQLQQLTQNPSSVQSLPGYQAQLVQGTQQMQRTAAAQGQTASGAELAALQTYGQQFQGQAYQQQLTNLSGLAGVNSSAQVAGGQAGGAAATATQNISSQNIGGLAGQLSILSKSGLLGGGGTQSTITPIDPLAPGNGGTPGFNPIANTMMTPGSNNAFYTPAY